MKSMLSHPDRLSGFVLVVVAGIAFADAWQLPFGSLLAPDAGFFPQLLSILLLIVGAIIVANSFAGASSPAEFSPQSWRVAIAVVAFIAYGLVLTRLGFVLATIGIMLLMIRGLGRMNWGHSLLIAVPSVLISYVGFTQLGVPLPRGFFFF